MYALAIIRYRRLLEEVLNFTEAHRAYLRELKQQGLLLAAGPMEPRNGGALMLRVPDGDAQATLDRVRDNDPHTKSGVVQYEVLLWNPATGKENLDAM